MTISVNAHKVRLGLRIKAARVAAGLSHDKLAARVGTSRQHLIRLEKGEHLPRPGMVDRIAGATGKAPAYFFADADDDDEDQESAELWCVLQATLREIMRREIAA